MFSNIQDKLNKAQGAFSLDALQDGDAYMEAAEENYWGDGQPTVSSDGDARDRETHENAPINVSRAPELFRHGLPSTLERLDLSHNRVVRIEGLEGLTRLRVLRLAHNQIRSCSGTEGLVALEELNLSANAIANALSVRSLACNHALRRLELRDNPLASSPR